ncbi:CinA family protein [Halomonas sp. WWR20]
MELLERITQYLDEQELVLATAESCTAGLIVSELARVPGSGKSIDCGLAVYSPEAKNRHLNVNFDTIEKYGLTSEAVSRELALGALNKNNADVAVANTGVAGPGTPNDEIEVGTLCFAWAYRFQGNTYLFAETQHFDGDRNEVRLAAAHYALSRISDYHAKVKNGDATPVHVPGAATDH